MNPNFFMKLIRSNILHITILVFSIILGVFIGSTVYYFVANYLIINALNILCLLITFLIFSFPLKVKLDSVFFLVDILTGIILISFYPFGQGYIIVLLFIFVQKLFKLI